LSTISFSPFVFVILGKCRVEAVELTLDELQERGAGGFPGLLGIEFDVVDEGLARAHLVLEERHFAPNGYVHAGAVVGLADTTCGYGCYLNLPAGGLGFTTVELKTNFVRSARDGTVSCEARLVHGGRTTQLWDAIVADGGGRAMAHFRCTQLVLY
jgi:1,4-dihydroxy-2-naphthoyl-CoA hydrolase